MASLENMKTTPAKELSLTKAMEKMKEDWQNVRFL